jgi:hypothetical protein
LIKQFGSDAAESIPNGKIVVWLAEQAKERNWTPASRTHWRVNFSLTFRVGIDNEMIERNLAARNRRESEGGGRVRFLSDAERTRLRRAIAGRLPKVLPHLPVSIHTGMWMSEQYGLRWDQVDFEQRKIHLPKTKNRNPERFR